MAKIEGFRVKNFRVLEDITLGKLWNTQKVKPLSNMTVVIGKNGVGKSTIFDVFGFLADCLKSGVEEACDMHGRGGFKKIISKGVRELYENGNLIFSLDKKVRIGKIGKTKKSLQFSGKYADILNQLVQQKCFV